MKPVVAIVGRPNVGKSALFNRVVGKQISLVYDRPGVTRDRISHECVWDDYEFTLVDTGGVGLDDQSGFEQAIQREVSIALETATDILLVVDGREGVNPLDIEIARRLRRAEKQVYLVVNKMDHEGQGGREAEFHQLGFKELAAVSAAHGLGIDYLMRRLTSKWEKTAKKEETENPEAETIRVAMVGRPNVGKSSLINAVLNEERVIVSPIAGTTRDAVDVEFSRGGVRYCFVDTAGMRKRTRVKDDLEQAMTSRSAHTINRAHVCVLVIDAVEGVSVQEKKIAGLIHEARKPCIILVNKWDLASGENMRGVQAASPEEFQKQYAEAVRMHLFFLTYAPVVFVSAKDERNLGRWLKVMETVLENRHRPLPTGILNRLIQNAMNRHHPATIKNRQLKIYYVSQIKGQGDIQQLAVFINDRALWSQDYGRYLEQFVRAEFDLEGCPLAWILKDKKTAAPEPSE